MAVLCLGPQDRPPDAIFLHANGFNALTYRQILAPLARRYRILAIDQRGHGATTLATRTAGRATWLDFRDDLLSLLGVMDLVGVVLCGHSLGATVSLLAAAEAPERVRRLVLFDPVILPRRHGDAAASAPMAQAARRRRAEFPSRAEAMASYRGRGAFATWPQAVLADYVEAGFRDLPGGDVTLACAPAWEASTYSAQAHDPWQAFAPITCPIEIFRAGRDSTCSLGSASDLAAPHGPLRVETISGTSHFLPIERPDLVRAALEAAFAAPAG